METKKKKFEEWNIPDIDDLEAPKVFIAFDVEYQPQVTETIPIGNRDQEVQKRRLEDVISFQVAFNYRNMHPVQYFVHRDPKDEPFIMYDIVKLVKEYLQDIGQYKLIKKYLDNDKEADLILEMWVFFGGVDISSLSDYQDILTGDKADDKVTPGDLITLHGNTVFTAKPLKLNLKNHYRHDVNFFKGRLKLVIRDETKLAPGKSNLAKLGKLVGLPKLDTEAWDREFGKNVGYYKSHMTELWQEHPDLFIDYASMDTIITALYGSFMLNFQKQLSEDGLGNFVPGTLKASLGSIISSVIAQKNGEPSDWICERIAKIVNRLKANRFDTYHFLNGLTNFANSNQAKSAIDDLVKHLNDQKYVIDWLKNNVNFDEVRKGYYFKKHDSHIGPHHKPNARDLTNKIDKEQAVLFDDFRHAYYGGYNVVFNPGVIPAHGVKQDVDARSSYNTNGHLIPDIAVGLGAWGDNLKNVKHAEFKKIVDNAMKINGPYTMGAGVFSIKYPKNYKGFVITPKRIDDGPRYLREINHVHLTFTDAYTAWICGAKVFTHRLRFAIQPKLNPKTMENVCNEGIVQDIFQQRREQYPKGDAMNIMYKNVGNQAYGTTAEGLREKRSRDFNNNKGYYIPFSPITSPMKAAQYTAVTRLHIVLMQKAIWQVEPKAVFLNNVTDGFLVWSQQPIDYDKVKAELTKLAHPLYRSVVDNHFNGTYFELKDGTDDMVANLRSRLTFSPDAKLHAMVGINASKLSPAKVFSEYLDKNKVSIPENNRIITGLVDMRHQKKFDHLQNSWNAPTELPLGYDFAQWPTHYHKHGKFAYWDTRPYKDEDEFKALMWFGRLLVKYAPFYSAEYASYFKRTLSNYNKTRQLPKKFGAYINGESEGASEIYYSWALYVADHHLAIDESYQKVVKVIQNKKLPLKDCDDQPMTLPNLSAFKAYVKRYRKGKHVDKVNYVLLHVVGLI